MLLKCKPGDIIYSIRLKEHYLICYFYYNNSGPVVVLKSEEGHYTHRNETILDDNHFKKVNFNYNKLWDQLNVI